MRILMISYFFPPFNSVGAVRPIKLAEFLHTKGHDVYVIAGGDQPFPLGLQSNFPESKVVYCPEWSVNRPVELLLGGRSHVARQGFGGGDSTSFKSRLGRLYKTFLHWPDAQLGWVRNAITSGTELLNRSKFDLIYISAPPYSGLRVASKLSKVSGVPWVAEFRDLWTDNHNYKFPAWRKKLEQKWEVSLLSTASGLVSVSPPLVQKLQRYDLPVWEIRNGFDPDDEVTEVPKDFIADGLNIVFTGNFYPDHYDLECFCSGLMDYRDRGGYAHVHIAGRNVSSILKQAKEFNLDDWFFCQPMIDRSLALAMQKHADVLLTFLWDGGNQPGIYSTKLFEYAGAGRPILAIGMPTSDVGQLLKDSLIGRACSSKEEVSSHLKVLLDLKKEIGELKTAPAEGFNFTRQAQFEILESELEEMLKN